MRQAGHFHNLDENQLTALKPFLLRCATVVYCIKRKEPEVFPKSSQYLFNHIISISYSSIVEPFHERWFSLLARQDVGFLLSKTGTNYYP